MYFNMIISKRTRISLWGRVFTNFLSCVQEVVCPFTPAFRYNHIQALLLFIVHVTPYCDSVEVGRIFQYLNMTPSVGTSKPEIRCVLTDWTTKAVTGPWEDSNTPSLACYLNTSRGRRVITSDSDFRVITPKVILKHTSHAVSSVINPST